MNHVVGEIRDGWQLWNVLTPITLLLDTGAEFAKIPTPRDYRLSSLPLCMTMFANAAEFVDCKVDSIRLFYLC